MLNSNKISLLETLLSLTRDLLKYRSMNKLSANGLNFIKSFEGFSSKPYLDSVRVPTIGYGTIMYPNGQRVTMSDAPCTAEQAEQYLAFEVDQKCSGVNGMVVVQVNQNQFDALVSFAYNLGTQALHGSTLLKLVNGGDYAHAANEFLKWDHAGGVVVPGLTRRRQAEQKLFLTPA